MTNARQANPLQDTLSDRRRANKLLHPAVSVSDADPDGHCPWLPLPFFECRGLPLRSSPEKRFVILRHLPASGLASPKAMSAATADDAANNMGQTVARSAWRFSLPSGIEVRRLSVAFSSARVSRNRLDRAASPRRKSILATTLSSPAALRCVPVAHYGSDRPVLAVHCALSCAQRGAASIAAPRLQWPNPGL